MTVLLLAALVWVGAHLGIAGSRVRVVLVRALGDWGFRGLFAMVSILSITFLIIAYRNASPVLLWVAPAWLRWVLAVIMLAAFLLFAAAILARNPTAIGGEAALHREPRGILRVTRHPMLWSFSAWALVHILGNGDTGSLLFFGAFLITALAGMPSIDAKVALRDREGWRNFAAVTSIVPFAAIAGGRNRLALAEIGWVPAALGVVLWAAMLWAHPLLFGASALPPA